MKEKLIIKNFGPIKEVDLDLGRFTILIGEQATGKSTVAKVLNLFRSEGFLFGGMENQTALTNFYEIFPSDNTYINYRTSDCAILFENGKFSIQYIGKHKEILERLSEISVKLFEKHDFTVSDEYYSLKQWYAEMVGKCIYIPAERGVSVLNKRLGEKIHTQYDADFNLYFSQAIAIRDLNIPYLKDVSYRREGNQDVVLSNGEKFLLSQTSSGFQSTIPMTVIVDCFSRAKEKNIFIIEEPELNLFPTTQNELLKYFVEIIKGEKNGLFIATHSPYILTSLNNMMYAYQMGKIDSVKASGIIQEKFWVNPDDVSTYLLKTDGTAENIMDEEVLQIKAERIDDISRQFNKEYDEMLDIKYPAKNEG